MSRLLQNGGNVAGVAITAAAAGVALAPGGSAFGIPTPRLLRRPGAG
jgi:hypothetical protein